MKTKIWRGSLLKGIAFVVGMLCIGAAIVLTGNTVETIKRDTDGMGAYVLEEKSFEQSGLLNSQFQNAAYALWDAAANQEQAAQIAQGLKKQYVGDYLLQVNGKTLLQSAPLTAAQVRAMPYYYINENGTTDSNLFNDLYADAPVTLYLAMSEQQAAPLEAVWNSTRELSVRCIYWLVGLLLLGLVVLVYLLIVTGRRPADDELHLVLIDRMPVEITVFLGGCAAAAMLGCFALMCEAFGSGTSGVMWTLLAVAEALLGGFGVLLVLSLVRLLKAKSFVDHSWVLRFLRWCWRGAKSAVIGLRSGVLQNYSTRKAVLILLGYTAVLGILGLLMIGGLGFFAVLLCIAWVAGFLWFAAKRISALEWIAAALHRMRGGDLSGKLPACPEGVMAQMADDINSLGEGMQTALQNEVRAERMKTELITNVSHDLKTPLTSIINYSELLCRQPLQPEEAGDYAKIIHEKSLRLKKLTSDLFDISKAQSGAEQLSCERLDACTLLRQALAEQQTALEAQQLTCKLTLPEGEAPIWADGNKMSRVLENLLGNCVKYALAGTRVFMGVQIADGLVSIEIKNTANYPMDFDEQEITERFVRGDAARSTEGSGLGLAIAKSYTEVCGGTFQVQADGDLFKVTLQLPLYYFPVMTEE